MIVIEQLDNMWANITEPEAVADVIGYKKEGYRQGRFSKVKYSSFVAMVDPKTGDFPVGLLPRVGKILKRRKKEFVTKEFEIDLPTSPHVINGITLVPLQEEVVSGMLSHARGVLISPTGTGKTIMGSCMLKAVDGRSLFIVHTKALYKQTVKRFKDYFGEKSVGEVNPKKCILRKYTVAMKGTLANKLKTGGFDVDWECVMGDEIHHASDVKGEYGFIFRYINPPLAYGLTATKPYILKNILAMESIVGPIRHEITYIQALKAGLVAKPEIKLIESEETDRYVALKGGYASVYVSGIVENRSRNLIVCKEVKAVVKKGQSVLVMVEKLKHGEILKKMLQNTLKMNIEFLQGKSDGDYLEEQRIRLENKEILCVIATRVWAEGIDIVTLDNVVNAVGGESEIATVQRFGRGTRVSEGKQGVTLIDIVDYNHKWFVKHSMKRIMTYVRIGWLS